MLQTAARFVVLLAGLWLVGLAAVMAFAPERAAAFLRRFASSARAHFTEHSLRLAAGAALVLYAPEMRVPGPFALFGWVLVATSALLMLVPWRWHRRFGEWVIPPAIRHLRLYSLGALALGAVVLWAAL